MPMYALATVSLIKRLTSTVKQTWYVDDATTTGKIIQLPVWWDEICCVGPSYGYFANGSKSWLVIKEEFKQKAEDIFADTNVQISSEGRPHLGVHIVSSAHINQKVQQWSKEVMQTVVWDLLHTTSCCLCFPYPCIVQQMVLSNSYHSKWTLPSLHADHNFNACLRVNLRDLIHSQDQAYSLLPLHGQMSARADILRERRLQATSELFPSLQRAMDLACEHGSSSWLTSLPIEEYGFYLHGAFVDALALRYGCIPFRAPTTCKCGTHFSIEHLLSCSKGGFPSTCHNELKDDCNSPDWSL